LFKFEKEQKIFEVGGVKIGGQPGELPTVLVGNLSCKSLRKNENSSFYSKELEGLIKFQEEISDRTGVPFMLDVFGESIEVLRKYVNFVSDITDVPFLINGPNLSIRLNAANYAKEIGLVDRTVYNSVTYEDKEKEILAIASTGLKAAIIQAFNPRNPLPEGMIRLLKGRTGEEGLIGKALRAGLEKILILTPGLDVPSIGFAVRAVYSAKKEFGLPAGTAAVGVVGGWKKIRNFGRQAEKVCIAGAAALAQTMGADFIMYGSIAKAKEIFPVCGMIDAIIAYNAKTLNLKPLTKNHPLFRIF